MADPLPDLLARHQQVVRNLVEHHRIEVLGGVLPHELAHPGSGGYKASHRLTLHQIQILEEAILGGQVVVDVFIVGYHQRH